MIRVEYYVDEDKPVADAKFHGFQIDADGLSSSEMFELEQRAARKAIDRYLDHRERIYADMPAELDNRNIWLIRGLARLPANTLWEEFQIYFLLARLRLLLGENPESVKCVATVNQEVSDALASLCEEFNVKYYSDFQDPIGPNPTHTIHSSLVAFGSGLHDLFTDAVAYFRPWLILSLFVFLRPIILKLYDVTSTPVDVRFWLHPFEDHLTRLYDAPSDLDSRGYQIGYALYNFHAMASVKFFVLTVLKTIRKAFEPDRPVPVELYIDPSDFRRSLTEAPRIREAIQGVGSRAKEQADSPEFRYLARQLEKVSNQIIVQSVLIERAIEGFSESVTDEVWSIPRGITKITPRLLAVVGERNDITIVGVSPHFTSETRVGYHLSNPVVDGPEAISLPDIYVVFEPLSAETLREQQPPSRIAVARDKMEAEACVNEGGNINQKHLKSSNSSLVSPPDASQTRVLVILTLPADNREIVEAFKSITEDIPDVKLVFKPHPLIPQPDGLVNGLQDIDCEVTSSNASLADLIETCDICIAMYSTAVIPALARATPVIWAPLSSPNHVRMDLITEVGIRADDPNDLARTLKRLVHDERFYIDQARECVMFAENKLVPDPDAPSLANLIEEVDRK